MAEDVVELDVVAPPVVVVVAAVVVTTEELLEEVEAVSEAVEDVAEPEALVAEVAELLLVVVVVLEKHVGSSICTVICSSREQVLLRVPEATAAVTSDGEMSKPRAWLFPRRTVATDESWVRRSGTRVAS